MNFIANWWFEHRYRIIQSVFQWRAEPPEEGGSIIFTVFGVVHFLKYKEGTICMFGRKPEYREARKWVRAYREEYYPDEIER